MAEEPGQESRDAPSNEDKPFRGCLIGFAISGAILGAILLVVFLWVWVHPTDPTEKKDFIQAVGVLLAALAALGGLYFTRTSTKDQLEQARKSQEQTQRLTEQGQITDRFTRAIDQLGSTDDDRNPRLEIRLGGIYALERIAWDSPERDHSTVMAVLTAYVRENSRRSPKSSKPPEGNSESNSTSNETAEADEEANQPAPSGPRLPTADIQTILDVLSRGQGRVPPEYRTSLDLHGADLQGADLEDADLQGAANLQGAILQRANLPQANLEHAYLQDAYLQDANLNYADLRGAILQGTILAGAHLQEAYFYQANLEHAYLQDAYLQDAYLQDADLRGADLRGADLQGIEGAYPAFLQGAANLQEANLQGADLQGANVTDEQLSHTASLQGATMPNGQKYEEWLKSKENGKNE